MDSIHQNFIYLDYNSTTPIDDRVLNEMLPYFSANYANPSGSHLFSLTVQDAVEQASEGIAIGMGTQSNNIIYTSGATEAINLVLKGLQFSNKKHIISISTEHKAVLETCAFMEQWGFEISYLKVDHQGMVNLESLVETIREDTALVCAMLANNETGVILPIRQITEIVHQHHALVLCDATQALGKIDINLRDLAVDFMVFSAHKFYGPKGVGGLYMADGAKKFLTPLIHGGGQQQGWRSGTVNTTGIIGMATALRIALEDLDKDQARIIQLRDYLESELLAIGDTFLNGSKTNRLFNTTNICFSTVLSEQLITRLGTISVSSGSACSAVTSRPSHVLKAMGLSDMEALSSIRFSLGRFTREVEISQTIMKVKQLVEKLRA
ncbi:cysteine desulfurase family protein [Sphingobacterium sp. UBA5670]|uniref:cysteine desulfurase family protein n=1 Tax=Sphingobacterium sp. UBA5670 TaxID=1947502 RepID=UPI00260083C4|nr:cysteine desulfurase family protein [Sphingobacterium sp. UBA5670]